MGTVWEIDPSYLATGTLEYVPGHVHEAKVDDFMPVTRCDGEIARSFRQYVYRGGDGAWVELSISKLRARSIIVDANAGRIQPRTIGGGTAGIMAAATGDDLLGSDAVIAEELGNARVWGLGVPSHDLPTVGQDGNDNPRTIHAAVLQYGTDDNGADGTRNV
ncbi:hypothetical protein [Tepidiforma sp.]|uniref:hypothetical protein n=1 Tax=Tepidiforma sp. TaxID=2682230 RepID=UPI002ADDE371|nr:hypothetical protein [Tepidiforma sp.]